MPLVVTALPLSRYRLTPRLLSLMRKIHHPTALVFDFNLPGIPGG